MIPMVAVTVNNFLLWVGSFAGFAILVLGFAALRIKGSSVAAKVGAMLDSRAARIDAQLRMAEENQAAARTAHEEAQAEIGRARDEASEIVQRAHAMTGSLRDELNATAEQDKNRIVDQARDEIAAERNRAILELRARAADVAVDAAREVLRRTVDERADADIIRRALNETGANGHAGDSGGTA